jgi:hypothetical protein
MDEDLRGHLMHCQLRFILNLLEYSSFMLKSIENGDKAFDMVHHHLFLKKMSSDVESYSVNGWVLNFHVECKEVSFLIVLTLSVV